MNEENYNLISEIKSSVKQTSYTYQRGKTCTLHTEAVCISYQNLGYLLDLYA